MRKRSLYFLCAIVALGGFFSCNRINGIDNNQVIQTPYSLYFSDSSGALYNSTDGSTFSVVFPADGQPCRAIATAGMNILWLKRGLYVSSNNGRNFNNSYSYDSLRQDVFRYPCVADSLLLNQTAILDVKGWKNEDGSPMSKVYTVNDDPNIVGNNVIGLAASDNKMGAAGWWHPERGDTDGRMFFYPLYVTSFTQMKSGPVVGYSALSNRVVYRLEKTLWKETTANPTGLPGVGVPGADAGTGLPDTAYCIGHYNDRLIALINDCPSHGAWFSDDTGRNWSAYSGLPGNTLLCIASPFEQVCLVGTRGAGLYILNTNTGAFQQSVNGLATNLSVRSITAKQNVFKNGNIQRFIYIATDKGIYQSKDGGINWTLTVQGNFVAIY
ncbi:MAG: hypothetical protein V4649_01165 [Bacteroidota bacterium]